MQISQDVLNQGDLMQVQPVLLQQQQVIQVFSPDERAIDMICSHEDRRFGARGVVEETRPCNS